MANSNLDFRMRLDAVISGYRRNMAQAQRDLLNFQAAANRINAQIPNPARNISSGGGLSGAASLNVSSLNPITAGIRGIGAAAMGAVAAIAGIGVGLREAIAATRQYQSLLTRFKYAFDGLEEGKNQLQFIREEANRLGLDFNAAANGYAQLAAATKNLNITTEQTQQIFKGVASAAAGKSGTESHKVPSRSNAAAWTWSMVGVMVFFLRDYLKGDILTLFATEGRLKPDFQTARAENIRWRIACRTVTESRYKNQSASMKRFIFS